MVSINLAGKERVLEMTLGAFSEFEDLTGKNALQENIFLNINAKEVQALLYASLKVHDPEITQKMCGDMVNVKNFQEVLTKLMEAYNEGAPEQEGDKKKAKSQ